jgi:hypothetical protein
MIAARYQAETSVARDDKLFLLHHTGRTSLRRLLSKKFNYGKSARAYLRKAEPRQAMRFVGLSLAAYLRNSQLLFRDPVHYLGIFPLRLTEFAAIRVGMYVGQRNVGRHRGSAS